MSPAKQREVENEIKNYLKQARQLQKTSEMFTNIVVYGSKKKTTTVIINTNQWKRVAIG